MISAPTVRIFFSSPGDVKMERETARRIVERLQAELGSRAVLEPYFWEHEAMVATKDYQANIPTMDGFDVVVCILWSRLGSPLHPDRYPRPGGGFFESGTEYEFYTAMQAHQKRGSPDVLVFRNRTEPRRPSRPKEARDAIDREVDRLDHFFEHYFRDSGFFTGAVNSYRTLGEFEDKLTQGLHGFLDLHLPATAEPRTRSEKSYAGRPYLGLSAFDFADAPVFFGRTAQVGEVVGAFRTQEIESRATGEEGARFVLVLGASGSGKSSLARAGVLPMLVQPGVIEGATAWRRAIFKPGDAGTDPFHSLAKALVATEALPELASDGTSVRALADLLRRVPTGAGLLVRQALSQAGAQARVATEQRLRDELRGIESEGREDDARELRERLAQLTAPAVRLALLADQLEELFTNEQPTDVTGAFVECLAALAATGRVFVLGTLRSDFYARCLQHPRLVELMRGNGTYALPAPGPAELGQMIRQPAAAAGLIFEDNASSGEKLDELLRDAALRDPAALPLLSYTLEQLHERRTGDGVLTLAAYRELGGLEGAIGRRAESVFTALPGEAQSAFDGVVRQLVTLGEGGAPVRRRTLHRALSTGTGSLALVDALVTARLLTADQGDGGERSISVAHEALLRHWPRLVKWVDENREFLRARTRLAARFAEWSEQKRTDHYLIQGGPALGEAESLLLRHADALDANEVEYIRRSTKRALEREQARLRRNRLVTIGAVVLTVVALIGGAIAWHERGIARDERATALQQKSAADESARVARASQVAAEQSAREAKASQTRAAYLLGIEMLESGNTRDGLTSLAQALTLDPAHAGARDRLYSYHLYGLPKAISLRSVAAPSGARQRISGSDVGPVQRCVYLDATGAPEIFDLTTRKVIEGPWKKKQGLLAPLLDRNSSHLLGIWNNPSSTGVSDTRCCVWSVETGIQSREFEIGQWFSQASMSDGGGWLAVGNANGDVRVWNVADGTLAREWHQAGGITAIDFDVGSSLVVTAGDELVFVDLDTGLEVSRTQEVEWVAKDARFAKDSAVCVLQQRPRQGFDAAARFVFVHSGSGAPLEGARTLPISQEIFDFALNDAGTELAVASFSGVANIFDRNDASKDRSYEHATYPRLVRFSPDARLLVSATSDGTVRIWDATTGFVSSKKTGSLAFEPISHDGRLEDLSVSWDGRYLFTSTSSRARVWDLSAGRALTLPLAQKGRAFGARFDPTGSTLWTVAAESGFQDYDANSLEPKGAAWLGGSSIVSVLLDAAGRRGVALLSDDSIVFADLAARKLVGEPWRPKPVITPSDWDLSGNGAVLALLVGTSVIFLDASLGQPITSATWDLAAPEEVMRLSFDGKQAAVVQQDSVLVLHDIDTHRDTALQTAFTRVSKLRFSPEGRWLAGSGVGTGMATENSVLVWDLRAPSAPPKKLVHGDLVSDLCFSPDSRWLATGTKDQIAQVWNAESGRAAADPIFHGNVVRKVSFSPDSTLLATDSGDGSVRVFDWVVARPVSQKLEAGGDVIDLAFTPDGTRLASYSVTRNEDKAANASQEGSVRLFEVRPPEGLPLDLVALTEAATAQRVSSSGLPVACDPSEGWRVLKEMAPDSWFFQAPTQRPISPAFTASSRRWINDGSIDLDKIAVSMPVVGEVRAATSYWMQTALNRRRIALEELRQESKAAGSIVTALEVLAHPVIVLGRSAAASTTRLPIPFALVVDAAFDHWMRGMGGRESAALQKSKSVDESIVDKSAAIEVLERQVAVFAKSAARGAADNFHTCLSLSLQAEAAGDGESARVFIDRALELAPDDRDVLHQASDVYLAAKNLAAEFAVLTRLRALEPEVAKHRSRLGFNRWRSGDLDSARAEFAAVVDEPETVLGERGSMLILLGRTQEIVTTYLAEARREVKAGKEPSADTAAMLSIGYQLAGDPENAAAWYQRLIASNPPLADVETVRGLDLMPAIKDALVAALASTLKRHPELRPKED